MNIKLYLILLLGLCTSTVLHAGHWQNFQAEITYEHIAYDTFRISYVVAKPCGISLNNTVSVTVTPEISKAFVINLSLDSSQELKPDCLNYCSRCDDPNCANDYSLKLCYYSVKINLEPYFQDMFFTFSSTDFIYPLVVSTGASEYPIYAEAYMRRDGYDWHSSPRFLYQPKTFQVPEGQCFKSLYTAKGDSTDSLVYKLVPPMTSKSSAAPYNSGYSYDQPFKNYSGNACQFSFDPKTAQLSMNVKKDVSPIAIMVEQYSKDNNGKWVKIGAITRVQTLVVHASANKFPELKPIFETKKEEITLCAGINTDFTIPYSDDDTGDTLRLNWKSNAPGLQLSYNVRKAFGSASVSWKPDLDDIRDEPYFLEVELYDDQCYIHGVTQKSYKIYVNRPAPESKLEIEKKGCGSYLLKALTDSLYNFTYSWVLDNDTIAVDKQVVPVQIKKNGEHFVTVIISNGLRCDRIIVDTIHEADLPALEISPDTAVCAGASFKISSSGGVKYHWWPAAGLSSDTIAEPVVSPPVGITTYYVQVTTAAGCTTEDSVVIEVKDYAVAVMQDTAICKGTHGKLAAYGPKDIQYHWEPKEDLYYPDSAVTVAKPKVTTTYYLTTSNSIGCTKLDSVTIRVKELKADAGPDVTICYGDSVQLHASGGDVYEWDAAPGITDLNIAEPYVKPLKSQAYKVKTRAKGVDCGTKIDYVIVKVVPDFTLTIDEPGYACAGKPVQLKASGGEVYKWEPAQYLNDAMIADPVANVSENTWFTLTAATAQGCIKVDSVLVEVDTDCVWPGDANKDGKADYQDVLQIAGSYSGTGSVRAGATDKWEAQPVVDWNTAFAGINNKHSDCDGNGKIENKDIDVIDKHYHYSQNPDLTTSDNNAPPVFFSFSKDTFYASEKVEAYLYAGDNARVFDSISGLGVRYQYSDGPIEHSTYKVGTLNSGFCQSGTCLEYVRMSPAKGFTDLVISNTSVAATGFKGSLATISYTLADSNHYNYPAEGEKISIVPREVKAIDINGNILSVKITGAEAWIMKKRPPHATDTTGTDTTGGNDSTISIHQIDLQQMVHLYPNPAHNQVTIEAEGLQMHAITVYNALGEVVILDNNIRTPRKVIETGRLTGGLYVVFIDTPKGRIEKKLLIQR